MEFRYYISLYLAYFAALGGWLLIQRLLRSPQPPAINIERPWLESGLAILAIGLTLLIGQLFIADKLLPSKEGWNWLIGSLNQILIFCPFILLIMIRRQPFETAWIPANNRWRSIGIGIVLALLAIFVFKATRGEINQLGSTLNEVFHIKNLKDLVQVFMEDFAIAVCFVRFSSLVGNRWAIGIVGGLFAAAHIPAMLASGFEWAELSSLFLDGILAVMVLIVLSGSQNILWFWLVHFAMDMMQFIQTG